MFWRRLGALFAGTTLLCNVYVDDYYRDNGLTIATTGGTYQVVLLNAEADTYTEANATFKLGTKTSPSLSLVDGTGGGRAAQCAAFTDGSVGTSGTASHWAVIDTANSRLISSSPLSASQAVTSGNTWSLGTFQYARFADAA